VLPMRLVLMLSPLLEIGYIRDTLKKYMNLKDK
jgi:hypothetical protein